MKAIYPRMDLVNRSLKRKYTQEIKKISNQIDDIQIKFELTIFEAPKNLSYKAIYEHFLIEWTNLVDKILKVYKLEYSYIDLHFFERYYKPTEGIK